MRICWQNCPISIYPNPTRGELQVQIGGLQAVAQSAIQVYSLGGVQVFSQQGLKEHTPINLTQAPAGVYLLKIVLDGKTVEWKVLKQ